MSRGIERQNDQYGAFIDDPGIYATRDRDTYDVPDNVPVYLASMAPAIATGLNNTRRTAVDTSMMDPGSHAYAQELPGGPGGQPWGDEGARTPTREMGDGGQYEPSDHDEQMGEQVGQDDESGYNWGPEPGGDMAGPGPSPDFHDGSPHPFGTPTYSPRGTSSIDEEGTGIGDPMQQAPPGHFSQARRRTADDAGSDLQAFQTNLYTPGDKLDAKSNLHGNEPERWPTAAAVGPAQPSAPADPVWLGHAFVPGHRVGMDWRGRTLPGTVTHLEGTDLGVRWDDGQFSTEKAQAIKPLY